MSDEETIEVPVTRRARVTLVGVYDSPAMARLREGDTIVLRPEVSEPFRAGTFRVPATWTLDDVRYGIPGARVFDFIYRVEPQETP